MKRLIASLLPLLILLLILGTACTATKRDCQGRKKYKHPNGFYMEPQPEARADLREGIRKLPDA